MAEKQKPKPVIVTKAAQILRGSRKPTIKDAKEMAGRILDHQKNSPQKHRPGPRTPKKLRKNK